VQPAHQNARGDTTRDLLIQAAERLFAERGIAAVPLRDIGAAAGQKNSVAVQYHFGDREALVLEVARYRAGFVEDLLADRVAGAKERGIAHHIRIFVESMAANLEEDNHYLAFLSRYLVERGGYSGLHAAVPAETIDRLHRIVNEALPDLSESVIDERWEIMMTTAVHTLARYQTAMHAGTLVAPIDELTKDLVNLLIAAFQAPAGR
jgi:AcrR family transcriptional regulator